MREFDKTEFNKLYKYEDQVNYFNDCKNINWYDVLENKYLSNEFLESYKINIGEDIYYYQYLSEGFIDKHKNEMNWEKLCEYQQLRDGFVLSNIQLINEKALNNLLTSQKVSDDICDIYIEKLTKSREDNVLIYLSKYQRMSEKLIEKYDVKLNWDIISRYQTLSEDFVEKHIKKVKLNYLLENNNYSYEFLLKHINIENYQKIIMYKKFSEEEIEKIIRKLDFNKNGSGNINKKLWEHISKYQVLSEEFIDRHMGDVNMGYISGHQVLSEEFIDKHIDIIHRYSISEHQVLSEEFIEKHIDKLRIDVISEHQVLSEKFIEKHMDKLNMKNIYKKQKLSTLFIYKYFEDFLRNNDTKLIKVENISEKSIKSYIENIDQNYMFQNMELSEEFMEWYLEYLKTSKKQVKRKSYISEYQSLSKNFIKKHKEDINFYLLANNEKIDVNVLTEFKDDIKFNLLKTVNFKGHMNDVEEENNKIKILREEKMYLKYYKIFNGDEKYLNDNNIISSVKIDKIKKDMKSINETFIDKKYDKLNLDQISEKIEKIKAKNKREKEKRENKEKRYKELKKNKDRKKIINYNEDNNIIF